MVSTSTVSEALSGVMGAPRRSMGSLTHLVPRPGAPLTSAESSPVIEAVRRDPALTSGQQVALTELYASFRADPAVHVEHVVDLAAASRAPVC